MTQPDPHEVIDLTNIDSDSEDEDELEVSSDS